MSTEPQLPDIRFDPANIYQEEVFTDRAAGTIRRLQAATLEEAIAKFPAAVHEALNQAIEEAQQMRREAQSRIVVPEVGGGMGGGGRIKL
jgi:hypothetical protein